MPKVIGECQVKTMQGQMLNAKILEQDANHLFLCYIEDLNEIKMFEWDDDYGRYGDGEAYVV